MKKEKDSVDSSTSAKDDTSSSSVEVAKSSRCEDPKSSDMIHTPQFHHPHHPHHRSFQVRSTLILLSSTPPLSLFTNTTLFDFWCQSPILMKFSKEIFFFFIGNRRCENCVSPRVGGAARTPILSNISGMIKDSVSA